MKYQAILAKYIQYASVYKSVTLLSFINKEIVIEIYKVLCYLTYCTELRQNM